MKEVLDKIEKLSTEISIKLEEYRREKLPEPIVFRYLYEIFQILHEIVRVLNILNTEIKLRISMDNDLLERITNLEHEVQDILYKISEIENSIDNLSHAVGVLSSKLGDKHVSSDKRAKK